MDNQIRRKRFFSSSQKVILFLQAQGKCLECDSLLETGWHADHHQPWSKGGHTEIQNGQALCPSCNLIKSDKEAIETKANNK